MIRTFFWFCIINTNNPHIYILESFKLRGCIFCLSAPYLFLTLATFLLIFILNLLLLWFGRILHIPPFLKHSSETLMLYNYTFVKSSIYSCSNIIKFENQKNLFGNVCKPICNSCLEGCKAKP